MPKEAGIDGSLIFVSSDSIIDSRFGGAMAG